MRWFKVAAIAAGVLLAFLVVSSVIGFLMEAAIAALVVVAVVLAFTPGRAPKHPRQRSYGHMPVNGNSNERDGAAQ